MGSKKPICTKCDSSNWHGFLQCQTCRSYFLFGKCKECDQIRLEKCTEDKGELGFIDEKDNLD